MTSTPVVPSVIDGSAELRRIGGFGFPIEELVGEAGLIAHLGRDSAFSIFFGRGRRVRLGDDVEWRIKATADGSHIVPIVVAPHGTVGVTGPLFAKRSYGINVKDAGYTLIPLGKMGLRRPGLWALRRHERQVAAIEDHDRRIHTTEPVPVAAVLLAFTLMTHGIPGEADLMPKRD